MNNVIENILNSNCSDESKKKQLSVLSDEIRIAKDIISGKYKYCNECGDYYIAESFLTKSETKSGKICIYEDPINSGGNDYAEGYIDTTYSICPKGHKHIIRTNERRR